MNSNMTTDFKHVLPHSRTFVPPKNTCVWNTVGSTCRHFLNVWCLYHKCRFRNRSEVLYRVLFCFIWLILRLIIIIKGHSFRMDVWYKAIGWKYVGGYEKLLVREIKYLYKAENYLLKVLVPVLRVVRAFSYNPLYRDYPAVHHCTPTAHYALPGTVEVFR